MTEIYNTPAIKAAAGETHGGHGRRGLLKCMVWAGTGVLWTVSSGVPQSRLIATAEAATPGVAANAAGELSFIQISDSHIGFANPPNPDMPDTAWFRSRPFWVAHVGFRGLDVQRNGWLF